MIPDLRATGSPLVGLTLSLQAEATCIPSVLPQDLTGRSVRANPALDEGVVAFICGEARRRRMTRTAFMEWMARRIARDGG